MKWILLVVAALAVAPIVSAQQLRSVPIRRAGIIADNVGVANLVTADVNGDGVADITSCSNGAPYFVSYASGVFGPAWIGPAVGCTGVAVGDRDSDGGSDVIVVTSGSPGSIKIFDPRSLGQPVASVVLPGTAAGADVAIGNVDSDPGLEIVAITADAMYVYDAATLLLKWNAQGYGGTKVRLGDVDGDGRTDIVVNGSPSYVLDGQLQTFKFGYLGGFGRSMAVGDVDGDGKAEIVFTAGYSVNVTILNGDTQTISTITGTSGYAIDSVGIGDADDDGVDEIITGNNQWGTVEGRRPSDGLQLWSMNNPEWGTSAVAAADATGDGQPEAIWCSGIGNSSGDFLFIADVLTKTIKWRSPDLDGPFSSAIGDLDGDGRLEEVVASGGSESGYKGSIIEIFDALSGASEGVLPFSSPYSNYRVARIAIGQVDNDPQKEIIGLVLDYSNTSFVVWDGLTHQIEFTSAPAPCCSPSLVSSALLVANVDADPVDEIILGQSDSKLLVFNGASNFIQTALPISGIVRDLAPADLNNDGRPEVIVGTTTTLYAFDTSNWTALGQVPLSYIRRVAATSAGGGTVAVSTDDYPPRLRVFTGATLADGWMCSALGTQSISALAFVSFAGTDRLLAGDTTGLLRLFSIDGLNCPAFTSTQIATTSINNLAVVDVTSDGRKDLLIDSAIASEIDLIGLSTELRGDVNGDSFISPADVDLLSDYVLQAAPGLSTSGDVNADQHIGVEDAFILINYQYGGGPALPP